MWDKITKKKLKTFKTSNAIIEINAGGKLVKTKEERGLLERMIVISRSLPQLDLKECIVCNVCNTTISIGVRWNSLVGLRQRKRKYSTNLSS